MTSWSTPERISPDNNFRGEIAGLLGIHNYNFTWFWQIFPIMVEWTHMSPAMCESYFPHILAKISYICIHKQGIIHLYITMYSSY